MIGSMQQWPWALSVMCLIVFLLVDCGKKAEPPASTEQAKQQPSPAATISSPYQPPAPSSGLTLGPVFARRAGDIDEMVNKRNIRALH